MANEKDSNSIFSKPGRVICYNGENLKAALSRISEVTGYYGMIFSYVKDLHFTSANHGRVFGEGWEKIKGHGVWITWENLHVDPIRLYEDKAVALTWGEYKWKTYEEHDLGSLWKEEAKKTSKPDMILDKIAIVLSSSDVWNKVMSFAAMMSNYAKYNMHGTMWNFDTSSYAKGGHYIVLELSDCKRVDIRRFPIDASYKLLTIQEFEKLAGELAVESRINSCLPYIAENFRRYHSRGVGQLLTKQRLEIGKNHDHEHIQTAPGAHTATEGCGILRPFRKHGQIASASRLTGDAASPRQVKTRLRRSSFQPQVLSF